MKPVPKQTVINTGDEGRLTEVIDSFFIGTKKGILKKFPGIDPIFEIREYFGLTSNGKPSDAESRYLFWNDRLVAGVLCTRTDMNNVQYTFFRQLAEVKRMYGKRSNLPPTV